MTAWATQGYFEVQGKGFMGKKWDAFVPQPIIWKEVFRVLKPGGRATGKQLQKPTPQHS
jgi:site-specific DNA-methyltransferase (adenine-specific)